ncbi:MAG: fimbrillin family protein [Tidjanibacter sp.]|nr:fimbrillin family protein [Tidjanibacter sp.]
MKTFSRLCAYAALALLTLSVSGCKDEIDENISTPNGSGKFVSFQATSDQSRTQLNEDGETVVWSGNEKLGVFYYTKPTEGSNVKHNDNEPYSISSHNESSATFTGNIEWVEMEGSHRFQLYYPYKESVTSASQVSGVLPAEQEYDPAGWNISDYDFLFSGTVSAEAFGVNPSITFKHLFSVLRLNITNSTPKAFTIERVKIISKSGLILSGEFKANIGKSKDYETLHNATTQTGTDGYFTTPSASVATTFVDGEVAAGESLDVRLMINAGFKEGSTTDYYLAGETLQVEVYTTGNPVWKSEFTAGPLARGARAKKALAIDRFDAGALTVNKIVPDYDATSNRFYLNTIATATGQNLSSIESISVGCIELEANCVEVGESQIRFYIPDTVEFTSATACKVVGYTADNTAVELGEITIYPFFYYKDVQLGLGSDASSTYTEYASENSIFVPDLGRVVSASEWRTLPIDSFAVNADIAVSGANPALSTKNTLDKSKITAEEYYAHMPYYFFWAMNDNTLTMAAPTNSLAVLRSHFYKNGSGSYTAMMNNKYYGTPIIWYRTLGDDNEWSVAVKGGTLTSIATYNGTRPSASAPAFGTATADGGTWAEGAVILTGYTSYAKGAKPSSLKDYAKLGFIHIKEITCADKAAGTALSPREGYIKFDFYWSKSLNDTASQPLYGDDEDAALSPSVPPTPPAGDDNEDDAERTAGTYTISSVAELNELKPLLDGDEIVWKNGTYANVNITLDTTEAIESGITFRAESNGGVIFTSNSSLQVKTSKTTVKGFHWKDPVIDGEHLVRFFTGTSDCTLTECAITGSNTAEDYSRNCKWVSLNGSGHTVEKCSFLDKRDRGALIVVWFDAGVTPNHTIRNNHFTRPSMLIDPTDGDPANEQECIRIGDSANSLSDGGVTVSGNYFYRCYGESAEVVSSKSCANAYSGNYFHECKGTLTLRHGNGCTVEGNYFLGNNVEESGGVRIIGKDHIVRGNHFESLTGIGYKAALSLVRGQENAALSGYAQVDNALVENNTFKECVLAMHVNYGGSTMTLPVVNSTIRNNTLVSTNDSNYIVRCENTDTESTITWTDNTLYGRFKTNVFSLTSLKTAPTLADVSAQRNVIANAAGTSWTVVAGN